MNNELETFITVNREMTERAVRLATDEIDSYLEDIIKKATAAQKRLKTEGTANVVDSNINGIESSYNRMIQLIERKNTFQQVIDYVFTADKTEA